MMKVKLRSAVHRDHDGHRHAPLDALRLRVELLAELHDVDALLAERRSDRRTRIRLARRHLQLDVALYFLRHLSPLWVTNARRGLR